MAIYINCCTPVCIFLYNRHLVHKHAVRRISKYLESTSKYTDLPGGNRQLSTYGIVYRLNKEKLVECYVDVNFSGGWDQADAYNAEIFISYQIYLITYTGYPVFWCSKLQKTIDLSTTEEKYITLVQVMRNVIPFVAMMK